MGQRLNYFLIFLMGLSIFGCKHEHGQEWEPLFTKKMYISATYENEWNYPIEGGTDWEHYEGWEDTFHLSYDLLRPRQPAGIRVQLATEDERNSIFNLKSEGGEVPLTDMCQSLLFYNNNTEFIVFDQLQSIQFATATTRSRSRMPKIEEELMEDAMNTPDMLYVHYMEPFKVSEYGKTDTVAVTMKPLVYFYLIQYEFSKGLEHISKARGSLSSMASEVALTNRQTSSKSATLMFDATPREFAVQALVKSFGIPDYPATGTNTAPRKHLLELEVKLHNSRVQRFQFDVTEQVNNQPRGGVIRVQNIELINEEVGSNNSGFDVDVSDWGDNEDIELDLTPLN